MKTFINSTLVFFILIHLFSSSGICQINKSPKKGQMTNQMTSVNITRDPVKSNPDKRGIPDITKSAINQVGITAPQTSYKKGSSTSVMAVISKPEKKPAGSPIMNFNDGKAISDQGVKSPGILGASTIMTEGFEGAFPSGLWYLYGDPTWDDDDNLPHSGGWSAWCANGGNSGLDPAGNNYPNDMYAWMVYGPFDLSNTDQANLLFSFWNNSEPNYDYFKFLASTNGDNFYGYQISGNTNGWVDQDFDLNNVPTLGNLCGQTSVWIAFLFSSDFSETYPGAYVDDIVLQKNTADPAILYVEITNDDPDPHPFVYVYVDDELWGYMSLDAGPGAVLNSIDREVTAGSHKVQLNWEDEGSEQWSDPLTQNVGAGERIKFAITMPSIEPGESLLYVRVTNDDPDPHPFVYVYVDDVVWGYLDLDAGPGAVSTSTDKVVTAGSHKVELNWEDEGSEQWSDPVTHSVGEGQRIEFAFILPENESAIPDIEVDPTSLEIYQGDGFHGTKNEDDTLAVNGNSGLSTGNEHAMGLIIPPDIKEYWSVNAPVLNYNIVDLLASIDWSSADSPVKNQQSCGSCWAFSAVALLENIGNKTDLSEQVIVSCADGDCGGGWHGYALEYIHDNGLPPENCYAYLSQNGNCGEKCSSPVYLEKVTNYNKYGQWGLPSGTTVNDLKALLQTGPALVSFDVPSDNTFDSYSGGIYNYNGGAIPSGRGHSVLVVGYSDDQQYFKVKNSWGEQWGENGYFRIAYDDVMDDTHFGGYACTASGAYTEGGDENTFNIMNTGPGDLHIIDISSNKGWLTVDPDAPLTIGPGGMYAIACSVDWASVNSSTDQATITIYSDDPDEPLVNVIVTAHKTVPAKPDLVISAQSFTPASGAGGTTLSINATVKNIGESACGAPSTIKYYLSNNATWEATDLYLGSDGVGDLAPDATSPETINWTIPANLALGTYYVIVCVDVNNTVDESDESNCFPSPVTVEIVGKPDLVASAPTFTPTSGVGGTVLNISTTVKNLGTASAGASSTIKYYFSSNSTWESTDTYIGMDGVGDLAPDATSPETINWTVPTSLAVGNYYVIVRVDVNNTVSESAESNDFASATTFTKNTAKPDLVVSVLTFTPTSGAGGTVLNISTTIKNIGSASADASTIKYYLSGNSTWESTDTYIGSDAVVALIVNGTSPESIPWTVPSTLPAGSYYVLIRVDVNSSVDESDESNDFLSGATFTKIPEKPDLVVSVLTFTPTSGVGGTVLNISTTIRNIGSVGAGASMIKYYFSGNSTWESTDTYIGSDDVASLAAGGTSPETIPWTIPTTLAAGSYYVIIRADDNNSVSESDENNDFPSLTTFTKNPDKPDLTVSALSFTPTSGVGGTVLNISTTIKNIGNISAGASTIKYYFSDDATWESTDLYIGADAVAALIVNGTSPESITWTIPTTLAAGDYYVIVRVDVNNTVTELDESNSFPSANTFDLVEKPDLVVSALTFNPTSGARSTTLNISTTVRNIGTASTGVSSTIKYYFSANTTWESTDTYIGMDGVGDLAGGGTSPETINWTVPLSVAVGSYYVIVRVDVNNTVSELDESNDFASVTTFDILEKPDLVVSSLTFDPTTGARGTILNISTTVKNIGTASAGASSTIRYYFSSNSTWESTDKYIGVDGVGDLAADGTSPESISWTVPLSVAVGSYYVIVRADAGNTVSESDESNDFASATTFDIVEKPDLVVSSLTFDPITGARGTILNIRTTVKNMGTASAGAASTIRYYFSANSTWESTDPYIGVDGVGDLAVNATSPEMISWTLPASLAVGTYYVIVRVDANNTVVESDESNDFASATTFDIVEKPDLVVSSLTFDPTAGARGTVLNISASVKNIGTSGAGAASTIRYYFSANSTWESTDQYIGVDGVGDLAVGGTSPETISWTIPASLALGTYYVIVRVDANNTVVESDESNDFASITTFEVADKPDLVISALTFTPTSGVGGTILNISTTVKNIGTTSSGAACTIKYYFSGNNTWQSTDPYIGVDGVGDLAVNATSPETISWTVPASLAAGGYYVIVRVDVTNTVSESNEFNSFVSAGQFLITSEPSIGGGGDGKATLDVLVREYPQMKSYPNPFVDQTTIHYTLAEDSKVLLRVYDLYGNLVFNLIDEKIETGPHQVDLEGRFIAKGMYYCVLTTPKGNYTLKMIKE